MSAVISDMAGAPPIDLGSPSTTAAVASGTVVSGYDPSFQAAGTFVYGKIAVGTDAFPMPVGRVCTTSVSSGEQIMTPVTNAAQFGSPLYISRQPFTAASQYGWFQT